MTTFEFHTEDLKRETNGDAGTIKAQEEVKSQRGEAKLFDEALEHSQVNLKILFAKTLNELVEKKNVELNEWTLFKLVRSEAFISLLNPESGRQLYFWLELFTRFPNSDPKRAQIVDKLKETVTTSGSF